MPDSPDPSGGAGGSNWRMAALATATAIVLASCSGTPAVSPGSSSAQAAGSQSGSATGGTAQSTPATSSPSLAPSELPDPPGQSTPATTAGELTGADLPTNKDIGPGWKYRVEGGDVEDGPGNGTPYQQRDPAEIAQVTVPMGCEQRTELSPPENVLQTTYRRGGSYAVALLMRFATAEQAAQFQAQRTADLQACQIQPEDPYSGAPAPVTEVSASGPVTRAQYRIEGEPRPWTTVAILRGADLLTVDANPARASQVDWDGLIAAATGQ